MARVAAGILTVHLQLLTKGQFAILFYVLIQFTRIGGRWRWWCAEERIKNPFAAPYRASSIRRRGHSQYRCLSKQAVATFIRVRHETHFIPFHTFQFVKLGQFLVHVSGLGLNQLGQRLVIPDQGGKAHRRLLFHRRHQRVRAPRVVNRIEPHAYPQRVKAKPLCGEHTA